MNKVEKLATVAEVVNAMMEEMRNDEKEKELLLQILSRHACCQKYANYPIPCAQSESDCYVCWATWLDNPRKKIAPGKK